LVDDNEINQELTQELLKQAGVTVKSASNGQEALDCLSSGEIFDGVLMDVQMPIMDGYTASKEIRQQAEFKQLPIIAMTANVMPEDREKTKQAGMNAHIGKPINIQELFSVLASWIKPAKPKQLKMELTNQPQETELNTSTSLPDMAGIDIKAGLLLSNGNKELYQRLLFRFREKQSEFKQRFLTYMDKHDILAAQREAHTLKGLSATLAMTELAEQATLLEKACDAKKNKESINTIFIDLLDKLEKILIELKKLPIEQQIKPVEPFNIKEILNSLQLLLQQLKENNGEAIMLVSRIESLLSDKALQTLLAPIFTLTREYDFDSALEQLQKIYPDLEAKYTH